MMASLPQVTVQIFLPSAGTAPAPRPPLTPSPPRHSYPLPYSDLPATSLSPHDRADAAAACTRRKIHRRGRNKMDVLSCFSWLPSPTTASLSRSGSSAPARSCTPTTSTCTGSGSSTSVRSCPGISSGATVLPWLAYKPRAGDRRGPGPEEADEASGERKAEEQVPGPAADVEVAPDEHDDHYAIWNLNRMARLNLMTPEWIEAKKKEHYEHVAFMHKVYDSLLGADDGLEEEDDEATLAELDEICRNVFANVDLSGLNTAGGESCGMDAVGVFRCKSRPHQEYHHGDDDAAVVPEKYNCKLHKTL